MTRLAVLLILLTGCGNYDISVNDQVIYDAPAIFLDFDLPDEALQTCVRQRVMDLRLSSPEALIDLNCSNAGIESLEGIALFRNIERLKLSSNRIRNLMALTKLSGLHALWLDDNVVIDPVPLTALSDLRTLNLADNDSLQCPKTGLLDHVETLTLPTHCAERT